MKSSNYLLECCVDSAYSARMAKKGGADRLELCSNLVIGRTTPTLALYEQIRPQTDIRIHVLIRPASAIFLYSEDEAALICKEIDAFRTAGSRRRCNRKSFSGRFPVYRTDETFPRTCPGYVRHAASCI